MQKKVKDFLNKKTKKISAAYKSKSKHSRFCQFFHKNILSVFINPLLGTCEDLFLKKTLV